MLVLELGRSEMIAQLAFAPDGRMLAAGCDSGVYLWFVLAEDTRAEQLATLLAGRVRFCTSGRWIIAGYRDLWRIDAITSANAVLSLWGWSNIFFDVSPTAPLILAAQRIDTTGSARTRLGLWRIDDLAPTGKVWEQDFAVVDYPPQFLAGGERFVRFEYIRPQVNTVRGYRVGFYDTATGSMLSTMSVATTTPYEALCSPDGRQLAVRGTNRIDLFHLDSTDTRPLRLCNDSQRHFTDMAFHPTGRYLAATSNDETVKLYDTSTGDVGRIFTWNIGRMRSVCFTPDGTLAAAGSDKGKVIVWDVDV